ncbi:SGNH/GDSL hydrolase family protein [Paractinoplanes brasiliensis]|uniref:Lysophospholipase L1-like esterase n=1 Tax=Paractinoplanes brasiliensis TaxID=52695 RepID=A0A4R6JLD1_9ACTN|nr:SGNH/GDSL hydrolase family protein [Actinoplanes brasiliensis]TDO37114.1 lysophospholipase L1-like esterase [Actinoplanes brasiliensis]GID32190.1 lipase 1 [Actinoplanes brasiliensis]
MQKKLFAVAVAAVAVAALAPGAAQAAAPAGTYVALGDSYAAGVGAPPYTDPTCLRGSGGYPVLLAAEKPRNELRYDACSGATTADLLSTQLGNVDRRTRVVTVTIGGNDLGFNGIGTCMQGTDADCAVVVDEAKKFTAQTLPGRLDAVFRAIRQRAPFAEVVVTGYARFFETTPECAEVPPASLAKRHGLNDAVDGLNAQIQRRAERNNVRFADVQKRFAGHGLCGSAPWMSGPAALAPFHPTAEGYRDAYLPAVRKALCK